jgi:hypothetical protein
MANRGFSCVELLRLGATLGRAPRFVSENDGSQRFVLSSKLGALCLESGEAVVPSQLLSHARHRPKRAILSGVSGFVVCEFARDTSDKRGREQGTNGRTSHHRLICALALGYAASFSGTIFGRRLFAARHKS